MQLDQGERGFSFRKKARLDMRMNPLNPLSAYEIVNEWTEKELGRIFRELGEERSWKKAALAITQARAKRPIETTTELAELIEQTIPRKGGGTHVATQIFQALRMSVNDELHAIEKGIKKALAFLCAGGKMGVLSFHSLEDRIVKHIFQEAAKPLRNLQGFKIDEPMAQLLSKKPLLPTLREIKKNPRSRSAKLRAMLKLRDQNHHEQQALIN